MMPRSAAKADVFHAIADPTRRTILDRLRQGPVRVKDLSAGFEQSPSGHLQGNRVASKERVMKGKIVLEEHLSTPPKGGTQPNVNA